MKYTWDANVESTAAGSRTETGAKASVEGKVGDAKKFFGLGNGSMAKGLGPPLQQNVKTPMGNKGPAPIMDQQTPATKELTAEQWNFAQGQLHPSMAAMDKLEKEGLKMVQLVGRDNKQDPLFVKLSLGCISICKQNYLRNLIIFNLNDPSLQKEFLILKSCFVTSANIKHFDFRLKKKLK